MKISLVIMAAGLGSRYGGSKQVDGVGPGGEILMEYGIHDALQAGFNRIVFIIKPDMEELMNRLCGDYLKGKTAKDGSPVEVVYAFQSYDSLPEFYTVPEGRTKPYGTVHALLCTEGLVDGPFCVINADDYYGADAYRMIYRELVKLPEQGQGLMVGYLLKNTCSPNGSVTRGVCTVENGRLQSVKETKQICLLADGTPWNQVEEVALDPESVVSMNFWGFSPSLYPLMRAYFEDFLRSDAGRELTGECVLPVMVDELMKQGKLQVSVLQSEDKWFGMTYQLERKLVAEEIRMLHEMGIYPPSLREG